MTMINIPPLACNPNDIYCLLGKSLVATQVLDHTIAYYIGIWTKEPPEKARAMVEEALKKAFGQLLKALAKHGLTPSGLNVRLDNYRSERNWLVHRYFAENFDDLRIPEKVPVLIDRIRWVHTEATELRLVFENLNDKWYDATGLPRDLLEREIQNRMDSIGRQPET